MDLRPLPGRSGDVLRSLAALAAFLLAAELAIAVLSGAAPPRPAAVDVRDWFSPAQLERAGDFRSTGRLLGLAALALEAGLIAAIVLWRPGPVRRVLGRLERSPWLGAAAVGAAFALAFALALTPLAAIAHERAVDAGLSTRGFGEWIWDRGKATALTVAGLALAALVLLALQRRLPRAWWAPAAALAALWAVVVTLAAPVLIAPLFTDVTELPPGPVREQVLELADRAGVEVGDVGVVDASRRSTTLNAYVAGLGPSREVVLYDNLVRDAARPLLRSVVAHELAHVANEDLWRGIGFAAAVAPFGMLLAALAGGRVAAGRGQRPGSVAALPAYLALIAVIAFAAEIEGNRLSRAVEARADRFALELTADPGALIDLQTLLARRNLSDPDPPGWAQSLFATHPSALERIGAAVAYSRGAPN